MSKVIHYFYDDIDIWKKNASPQFRMCYASWLKFCPDYEIKLWHTDMPEFKEILEKSKFVRECYKQKLWAFIADYIRHYALYNYGGIYLDTDVQLVKSLDNYVEKPFFCSIEGDFYKRKNLLESAVMGGQKGHKVFKEMLDIYNSDEIFSIPYFISPVVLTEYMRKNYGFENIDYSKEFSMVAKEYYQTTKTFQLEDYSLYRNQQITRLGDMEIYPSEYFCPSWTAFGEKAFTENTVAIHWNQSSWKDMKSSLRKLEAFKYTNPIKRFWYIHSPHLAKTITFVIPNKKLRKKIRKLIILE